MAQNSLPDWALGPFVRPANVNPIISPNPNSSFIDPMTNKKMHGKQMMYLIPLQL